MLSKKQRLSRKEFSLLYKTGKRGNTKLFSFIYKKSEKIPQFSVVVSKKVSKSAVQRHLIKRRFYHAIHSFLKENKNFTYSVILITSKQPKISTFIDIKDEVYKTLKSL